MLASIVDDEPINPGPFAGIVRARTRVFSDEKFEFVLEKRDVDVMRLRFRVPFRGRINSRDAVLCKCEITVVVVLVMT